MKTNEQGQNEARRQHTEAIVAQHLERLFQRVPMLSGFWVQPDLDVAELAVFTWPGHTPGQELYDEIMYALADLAEERPEAMALMRGRAFARAVH